MDLSIIIVNYNTKDLTTDCIKKVAKYTKGINYQIIVVDNGSSDDSIKEINNLRKLITNFILIKNKDNLGFAKANNQGLGKARGRYLLLLNSDTVVESNFLKEMIYWMDQHPKVGITSCALRNRDGSIQGTGGYFPTLIRVFSWMTIQDIPLVDNIIKPFHPVHQLSFLKGNRFYQKERELDWVTGAFLLMRREVYQQIGLLDEDYFMYTEDTDYCYRAKMQGWEIYYLPKWSIVHHGGASGVSWGHVVPEYQGIKLFYKKHFPAWQYQVVRFLLKIGALGRIFVFGVLKGKEAADTYVEAFKKA